MPRAFGRDRSSQRRARRRINRFSPKMAAQSDLRSTISGRPFARAGPAVRISFPPAVSPQTIGSATISRARRQGTPPRMSPLTSFSCGAFHRARPDVGGPERSIARPELLPAGLTGRCGIALQRYAIGGAGCGLGRQRTGGRAARNWVAADKPRSYRSAWLRRLARGYPSRCAEG
jgi:hypothetical protein